MPTVTTRWRECLMAASAAASSASFMIVPPWMLPALLASVTPIQWVISEHDSAVGFACIGLILMSPAATLVFASNELAKEDAMPGLSGRMSTVVKAKISKLLDRAEDPSET